MIGIYTYSLIIIALALIAACTGTVKAVLLTGAGLHASICTGAFPPTGTSCYAPSMRLQLRNPSTANALYAAVGNSLSAVFLFFLPTAFNQRKITVTTPGSVNCSRDSSFYSFDQPVY